MTILNRPRFPEDSFETPLRQWLRSGAPVLKGVYAPTGSGKTRAASRLVVDAFHQDQVIPIYVAPLKRLIEEFIPEVTQTLQSLGLDIPIYRIYARSDFENDDTLLEEVVPFCTAAKQYFIADRELPFEETDDALVDDQGEPPSTRITPAMRLRRIEGAVFKYRRARDILKLIPSEDVVNEMKSAMSRIWSDLNYVCAAIVEHELLNEHAAGLFQHSKLRPMLLRLVPLNLFDQQPGIFVSTTSKFASKPTVYSVERNKLDIPKLVRGKADSFFGWAAARPERFLLLVDEEEESHQFIMKSLKKELTNKDVDLHRVIYSFFHHFDLSSFSAYAEHDSEAFARKLFDNSGEILRSLDKIQEAIVSNPDLDDQVAAMRGIPCCASFSPSWVRKLIEDFLSKHDVDNRFSRLEEKLRILETVKRFIQDTIKPWPDRNAVESDFDVYRRLENVFHDKKHILINTGCLGEFRTDMVYLFFNERLEIYEHEILEQIRVAPVLAHNNLELISAASLQENKDVQRQKNSFSLGEFLRFVMLITRVILRTRIQKPLGASLARISDHQWKVLSMYRNKIGGWRIPKDALPELTQEAPDEPLTAEAVFRRAKFALSIVEDSMHRQEYANDMRIMSIAATVLKRTPEDMLDEFLTQKRRRQPELPGNLAYVLSATGGMGGCWGGLLLPYLGAQLEEAGGRVIGPTDSEFQFMRAFREYRASKRQTAVKAFDREIYLERIEPGDHFHRVEHQFIHELVFEGSHIGRNPYKVDELKYLCALLWRLALGPERSAIAFTQTVGNFRLILDGLSRRGLGVEADERIEGLYTFDPAVFGGPPEPIRLILYTASFGQERRRLGDGESSPVADGEISEDDVDESRLQSLLDEREQKLLVVSSFRSGNRGLNLTPKCKPIRQQDGRHLPSSIKDFDILMLAMSPYYDGLYRVSHQELAHMERLQAMQQRLYLDGRLSDYHLRDLPAVLRDESDDVFYDEYLRKIGREMVQTIGRVERVEDRPARQLILINQELVRELAHFHQVEPDFHRRLSAGNYAVYEHVKEFVRRTRMFETEAEWADYAAREIVAGGDFLRASRRIYRGFRNNANRQAWARIRSPLMFRDPAAYLATLASDPEGLDQKVWQDFVSNLFIPNSLAERYVVKARQVISATPGLSELLGETLCALVEGAYGELAIYADLDHGKGRRFDAAERLVPRALRSCPEFAEVQRKLGLDFDTLYSEWVPRPQFFNDYVKGYFAELVMQEILARRAGIRQIDPLSHPGAAAIFERFDIFIEGRDVILALDLKNWNRRSDRMLGARTRMEAVPKVQIVAEALRMPLALRRKTISGAQRVGSLLGKRIIPIYINLCGERPHSDETLEGYPIHFYNLFVAVRDEANLLRYELNADLLSRLASVKREA
ncbi:DEAD/DEAH box helicase [Cupriavidus lacunae]|uniref:DEAD/DEAH-box helicase domain-containing protein n=1 Tax=Cupriavidus lacunae TaxID=2666307 RepID=A0A370MY87_9BURK|nr:DEAD/DEAH box helicase [Cupriavidus lacunae]RDJ98353.1 hypothetical protein DN412_41105 [Cupriavidus lacunae]